MTIRRSIEDYLYTYSKQTIPLDELELLFPGSSCSYRQLAEAILELEDEQIVQMVRAQGRNGKQPSLAYQYRVNKSKLKQGHHKELQRARLRLHPLIQLDSYFTADPAVWQGDRAILDRLDRYLRQAPLPTEAVPAPERSYELVGDEKWITEQGGKELLERVRLWERLRILSVADPLMFAIHPQLLNPRQPAAAPVYKHLIVENKTTYQGLLPALPHVSFATLIYGCGKKIIKSIELFPVQIPLLEAEHRFYYFGDLDHEGIHIWHSLTERAQHVLQAPIQLAIPFYQACLDKTYAYGKQTHRKDESSLEAFLHPFSIEERQRIRTCLAEGGYYPQEALKTQELGHIWRTAVWN
ncbi:Wadjet anti-phage system protein JetD domain-containing protein [Paenibacillus koleovorans]|uniref:Wadjet anti-phage system protein JetD domain-containing protein n=1 Tax=Paenibacillus koleovorans TaxID=121608 RepID=UPI000FD87121|nr:Wadjet anti-phage system protein JetD domain-containing protein [Paenibacillus koleovorans]